MNIVEEAIYRRAAYNSRRHFLRKCTSGLGALALGTLMGCDRGGLSGKAPGNSVEMFVRGIPHFAP